jgi:16S rRNA A1518/A1519 N6-dimethyltransferase RsmA/KsgA/DIM1 with predicted DNA glycosylase/AP lyase activity
MYLNKLVYSAYDAKKFSPKPEIFASNVKLNMRQKFVQKNGNNIKGQFDKNGFISRNYSTRSKIPELAIKDFFDQAIAYIEGEKI